MTYAIHFQRSKAILLGLLFLAGCGASSSTGSNEEKRYTPFQIDGLIVPGAKDDAIKTGFTECKDEYQGFSCKRKVEKPFFGITPISSSIYLDEKDNFLVDNFKAYNSKVSNSVFTYREVKLEFRADTYNQKCLKQAGINEYEYQKPSKCLSNSGIGAFRAALESGGWIKRSWKSWDYYEKEGTPLTISIKQTSVTISPETAENISNSIREIKNKNAAIDAKERSAKEFIDSMKR